MLPTDALSPVCRCVQSPSLMPACAHSPPEQSSPLEHGSQLSEGGTVPQGTVRGTTPQGTVRGTALQGTVRGTAPQGRVRGTAPQRTVKGEQRPRGQWGEQRPRGQSGEQCPRGQWGEQHPRGQWGGQCPRGQWRGNSAPGDSWRCLETFSLSSLGDGYWHWAVTEHPMIHRACAPNRDCQEWPAQTSIVLRVGNPQKHLGSFLQMWSPKDSDTRYGQRAELSQKV